MTDTPQQRKSRIPEFKNRQEMAEWWDTHDVADYLDELKQVKIRFAKKLSNLSETLNIRLEPDDLAKLRQEAQRKGIGPTTLVRIWVREHLQEKRSVAS